MQVDEKRLLVMEAAEEILEEQWETGIGKARLALFREMIEEMREALDG